MSPGPDFNNSLGNKIVTSLLDMSFMNVISFLPFLCIQKPVQGMAHTRTTYVLNDLINLQLLSRFSPA